MNNYLKETRLLNYSDKSIQELIRKKKWFSLDEYNKIENIYNFVRDDIYFGYNIDDAIPASHILSDGYGQCNTKSILFMALLRATGIQCRLHGFTIYKTLQKGAISGIWYKLSPDQIVHSWVEIVYDNNWYNLEGFILDLKYLTSIQKKFNSCTDNFCGFGIAVESIKDLKIYWNKCDTYIQKEGIAQDFGIYDNPDDFFKIYKQQFNPIKKFVYRNFTRHIMNKNINRLRLLY